MFQTLYSLADHLYDGLLVPFFLFVVRLLNMVFIHPLIALHVPLWLHLSLLAALTAGLSFAIRKWLKAEEKTRKFHERFAEKRKRQQDLRLIPEKHSRLALYRVTDKELDEDYNRWLARHYARYVMIYLPPVFLALAWLNSLFPETALIRAHGIPFVCRVPANRFGIQGLSVTAVFLLAFVISLATGFYIRRRTR